MLSQFRNFHFYLMILADVGLCILSMSLAYLFRFDFYPETRYLLQMPYILSFAVPIKIVTFFFFGLYRGMWRYTDLLDFWRLFQASFVSSLIIVGIILYLHHFQGFPRSVFVLDGILTFILCGSLRVSIRTMFRYKDNLNVQYVLPWKTYKKRLQKVENVLIIGAGDAGEKILREIIENPALAYNVSGFLDDDIQKKGRSLHGVPVLGTTEELGKWVDKYLVNQVFIAIPAASGSEVRRLVHLCEQNEVSFKILPAMTEVMDGRVSISDLRDVNYEDLIGREQVNLDTASIGRLIKDKTILVSGAGGSVGSELCRQIIRFEPKKLILLDISELNLYTLENELRNNLEFYNYEVFLGNLLNRDVVDNVFAISKPEIVFHAAAYKHVPMLEKNPWQAISNNVLGSKVLMETAKKYSTEKFVIVSTDKAVKPVNVMGATKRITELLMYYLNDYEGTRFMAVRFGNVVGSSGSVVPLFKKQIQAGGPVEVTHPEVTRYFMTISEASQLILQACTIGEGGEIFILNMGTPVKIYDLAKDLIRLMGEEPFEDVDIVFTGLRPGEKINEELLTKNENESLGYTEHEKILVVRSLQEGLNGLLDKSSFEQRLQRIKDCSQNRDVSELKQLLRELVPEYSEYEASE